MERPLAPPDPPLADGVVALRPWEETDIPTLVRLCNGDEALVRWLRFPDPYTEADARTYLERGARGWSGEAAETPFAVIDAASGDVVGACGVVWVEPAHGVAEVGYWTARDARGRGIAARAVRLVARWVLGDVGYERLQLRADTRNGASIRVAQKAGFTEEGVLRSARESHAGRRVDDAMFSVLRSELGRVTET